MNSLSRMRLYNVISPMPRKGQKSIDQTSKLDLHFPPFILSLVVVAGVRQDYPLVWDGLGVLGVGNLVPLLLPILASPPTVESPSGTMMMTCEEIGVDPPTP